jgi:glycosyltransferase involved in cell wall biosynthesis
MRITHVSDCYFPRLGGIELQVHDLAAHQIADGHEVDVLTSTPSDGSEAGAASAVDVPVRRIANSSGDFPSLKGLDDLRLLIETGHTDVVHAHSSIGSPLAWAAVRSAARAGVPAVITVHSMLPSQAWALSLSDLALGWSGWPVQWTAVSSAAAAPLRSVLGDDQVTVLPNGIDLAAWRVTSPRPSSTTLTVISVMRLSRRKRPHALIGILAAIRRLLPRSVTLRAVIVGDGPQRHWMEQRLHLLGMNSWVTLTGALSRDDVREALILSDVYLAPARRESFGIAALEARCMGLPVVAMASGGVGEFVQDGLEGFLVRSDPQMAQVTAALLVSPGLRSMQEHNRVSVPAMSWPLVVAQAEELYARAGAPAGSRRGLREEPVRV